MHKITIMGTSDKLSTIVNSDSREVILRTEISTSADILKVIGIDYTTLDSIYEDAQDFDELDVLLADRVISIAKKSEVLYIVPGSAVSGDGSAKEVICRYKNTEVIPGDAPEYGMLAALCDIDTSKGYTTISAACIEEGMFSSRLPLIVTSLDNDYLLRDIKILLSDEYSDEHEIFIGEEKSYSKIKIYEMDRYVGTSHKTMMYVPPKTNEARYDYHELEGVFRRLRAPGGCPWDREQTHESLKRHLLEECAEVLDAIDSGDMNELMDELGDVMLQVIFHAMIASERGDFDMRDITDNLARKLIRRHPHVFADSNAKNSEEVLTQWDKIKHDEKEDKSHTAKLMSVPKSMTALMRAQKVLSRAAKTDYLKEYYDDEELLKKIESGILRLGSVKELGEDAELKKAIGTLLFDVANLSRAYNIESELALRDRTKDFIIEFKENEGIK